MPDQPCTRYDCDCPTVTVTRYSHTGRITHRDMHGRYHCTDGPAIVHPDRPAWYRHGTPHRTDGPAFHHATDPDSALRWHIEGTPTDPATCIDDWLTRHHPETDPTTRALLHDLAIPWPGHSTLAELYTAAHAASRD